MKTKTVKALTDLERSGLLTLWKELHRTGMRREEFEGAIGRAGTGLVRRGLARNLGRHIYANNRPEMGERPDAYVKFELTPFGKSAAALLFKV